MILFMRVHTHSTKKISSMGRGKGEEDACKSEPEFYLWEEMKFNKKQKSTNNQNLRMKKHI